MVTETEVERAKNLLKTNLLLQLDGKLSCIQIDRYNGDLIFSIFIQELHQSVKTSVVNNCAMTEEFRCMNWKDASTALQRRMSVMLQ